MAVYRTNPVAAASAVALEYVCQVRRTNYPIPQFPLCGTIDMAERVRAGVRAMFSIRKTKHVVLVAADGSLHPGAEMLEDET